MWIWVCVSFRVFLRGGTRKQESPWTGSRPTRLCREVGLCTASRSRLSRCCSLRRPCPGEGGATETDEAGTQALAPGSCRRGGTVLELGRLQ